MNKRKINGSNTILIITQKIIRKTRHLDVRKTRLTNEGVFKTTVTIKEKKFLYEKMSQQIDRALE